jgi:hypothetical protein
MARKKIRSWIVEVECTVIKNLVVENCTEEEAYNDPWECDVVDEQEIAQMDWKVRIVSPNK